MLYYRRFHTRDGLVSQLYSCGGLHPDRICNAVQFSQGYFSRYAAPPRLEVESRSYEYREAERRVGMLIYHYYEREA